MGKITVKHYLNTSVKDEQSRAYSFGKEKFILNEEETLYPVYLQVTVNRKTTKLRSYIGRTLLKDDFQEYLETGTFYAEDKVSDNNPSHCLKQEIIDATNALDYFYNIKEKDQNTFPIKNVLDFYLLDIDGSKIRSWLNEYFFDEIDSEYDFLLNIVKKDINPVLFIEFCSEHLKIDIYEAFYDDFHLNNYKA